MNQPTPAQETSRPMRTPAPARSRRISLALLGLAAVAAPHARAQEQDERQQSPIEVQEWSIWVGTPVQSSLNTARLYRNAMPDSAGTSRPKIDDKELNSRFPIAPISVVQFFGEPAKDIDVDLRIKSGTLLSHWPATKDRGGRLQWFKSDLAAAPPADLPPTYIPESHWFQKLRATGSALFLKHENTADRFLAYDAELALPIPLKLRGGPDEYTLQNLTEHRLLDVALVVPTEGGFRVGWLDELPTAAPEKDEKAEAAKKKAKEEADRKKTDGEKAAAVFEEATKPAEDKEKDALKPLPAEGDATVRARMDQVLNRPVTLEADQVPLKDALDLIAGQARLRYELDEPGLAKEEIDPSKPITLKVANLAARDALGEALGNAGLSYRITDSGTLFITTAARLAEDPSQKGAAIEGPPIKLTLSQPLKPDNPSYGELTRDAYARRLAGQGLREETAKLLLDQYGRTLFEPERLIVIAHLSPAALDDAVPLDVFPPPKKQVRTAILVIHGIDPRLQDHARTLVLRLGDKAPAARESAEAELYELGPVAVPALEDALISKDIEIVFRAERILMRLSRPVP